MVEFLREFDEDCVGRLCGAFQEVYDLEQVTDQDIEEFLRKVAEEFYEENYFHWFIDDDLGEVVENAQSIAKKEGRSLSLEEKAQVESDRLLHWFDEKENPKQVFWDMAIACLKKKPVIKTYYVWDKNADPYGDYPPDDPSPCFKRVKKECGGIPILLWEE